MRTCMWLGEWELGTSHVIGTEVNRGVEWAIASEFAGKKGG